jgi:hypothetical protein
MGIQVQPHAVTASAQGFQQAATAVTTMRTGVTTAADRAAAAAADPDVQAGLGAFQRGVADALAALADRAGRYGRKVSSAADRYHGTDEAVAAAVATAEETLPGSASATVETAS